METIKICTACKVIKPLSEFNKFVRGPFGLNYECRDCQRLRNQASYAKNAEANKARSKEWRLANPEKHAATTKKWREENKERYLEIKRINRDVNKYRARLQNIKWRSENRERMLTQQKVWKSENVHICRALSAKRAAAKKRATPSWANKFYIEEAYHLAQVRQKVCGGKWHVDHIVPLQSDLVCGLHCEANLQVIPGPVNQSKKNYYWPNMP